jgi:SET domain-containing protein
MTKDCVQCSAATRAGGRCKNITCIYSEFCNVHTKALFDLAIKPSKIPNSGKGLFTLKAIAKNRKIAKYTGEIKTLAEYNANPSGYAVGIPKGRVVDADSTQSDLGRYVNDCRAANRRAGQCKGSNARFAISTKAGITTIWIKATKNIPANSEIYVAYGASYWR